MPKRKANKKPPRIVLRIPLTETWSAAIAEQAEAAGLTQAEFARQAIAAKLPKAKRKELETLSPGRPGRTL